MTLVLSLLACLILALVPATAEAKKKHKKPLGPVVTATATGPTVTVGSSSVADANCPTGLQAVGGGFSAPFTNTNRTTVEQSYRSAPGTWRVSAFDGAGTGAATSYAYCRRMTRAITAVSNTGTVPGVFGGNAQVEADCPAGTFAVSGGFQITTGPTNSAVAVPMWSIGGNPPPGGTPSVGNWMVAAQSNSTFSQTITTHVYCMSGIRRPAFKQDQVSAAVPNLGTLSATSFCPPAPKKKHKKKRPRQLLSAGAFYSPFTPGSTAVFPIHTDSRIVGSGFLDTAVNPGSGGTMTVQSQALCF